MILPSLRIQKNEFAHEVIEFAVMPRACTLGSPNVHAGDVHTNCVPPSRFPFREVRCEPNALGVMEFN